jgi:thiamine kinase-like enzyme
MDEREPMTDTGRSSRPDTELVRIVQQLSEFLGETEGEPKALEGGITNRNFRARMGGREYVIRVPGKDTSLLGIDRNAERTANERAARAGVAPPVAAALDDPQCIVTAFIEGRGLEPEELREPEMLFEVARSLRAVHDSGQRLSTRFDSFRIVEDYAAIARERGAELPGSFTEAQERAAEIRAALSGPEHDPVPCHNDLLAGNFLHDGKQLWIVDWEYAGMGDRYFDLANFSVNNELGDGEIVELLTAYFAEPPGERRLAELRLMTYMSDFREAMWGVVQGTISDLDFDFGEYAAKHFARMAEVAASAEFAAWIEGASGAPR